MKRSVKVVLIIIAFLSVVACSNASPEELVNVGGNTVGYRTYGSSGRAVSTTTASIVGASNMDAQDQQQFAKTLEATPTGKKRTWSNTNTKEKYSIEPTQTYVKDGQPCRHFVKKHIVGGEEQQVSGTACRSSDGAWQIL